MMGELTLVDIQSVQALYAISFVNWTAHKGVIRLTSQAGHEYCLKPITTERARAQFVARAMEHLYTHGFRQVPDIYRTVDGQLVGTLHGVHCLLMDWIDGARPSFSNSANLRAGAKTLASLHAAASGLQVVELRPSRDRMEDSLSSLTNKTERVLQILKSLDGITAYLLAESTEEVLLQLQSGTSKKELAREARVLAFNHGDYNYANLVRDLHGDLYVIDFDHAMHGPRILDLAHLCWRNTAFDAQTTLRLIGDYGAERQLHDGSLALLRLLLRTPLYVTREVRLRGLDSVARSFPSPAVVLQYLRNLEDWIR